MISLNTLKHSGKKNQKGLTLIEFFVALLAAAVLLAIAISVYSKVKDSQSIKREIELFQQVVAKVQTVYPNSRYTGLTTAAVTAAGAFPESSLATSPGCGTNVPHNSWNGCLWLAPGTTSSTLDVNYSLVPAAACIGLLAGLAPAANSYNVSGTARVGAAMTAANIAADCGSNATSTIIVNTN
jgi:Tfp pilus assembly protein PilW